MTRYAMAIDAAHCIGCMTCTVACQHQNALRPGVAWLHVDALEWGAWPQAGRMYVPHSCLACDDAPCAAVCPTGASYVGEGGAVLVDYERCIGCGVCVAACPFGARRINRNDTWFYGAAQPAPYEDADPTRLGVAEKCDLCAGRRERGLEPACVEACLCEVRAYGDLDDADDPIHAFIARTGARSVGGTATWYAQGACELDLDEAVRELGRRRAGDAAAGGGMQVKPAVLAGAAALGAAGMAGIAATALHERRQRSEGARSGCGPCGPEHAGEQTTEVRRV